MNSLQRTSRWLRWWIVGYMFLVSAVVGAMFWARQSAMSSSISEWQTWREAERKQQSGPKVVERRVPKSDEPPALVLMRDFFAVLMVGALVFSSMLYWIIAWFITGIMRSQSSVAGN
jgi:hypothetical protein